MRNAIRREMGKNPIQTFKPLDDPIIQVQLKTSLTTSTPGANVTNNRIFSVVYETQ
jgi:hypothetical protein